jgi:hypothetical protein
MAVIGRFEIAGFDSVAASKLMNASVGKDRNETIIVGSGKDMAGLNRD